MSFNPSIQREQTGVTTIKNIKAMYYPTKSREAAIYDFIINNNIATEAEITLVTCINGWSCKSLNDIIFQRTEYHNAEQCISCEPEIYFDLCGDFTPEEDEDDEDEDI